MRPCERCGAPGVRERHDRLARFCSRLCGGLSRAGLRAQTRADVLTAAAQLGPGATQGEIARRSGYALSTVQGHLRSKKTEDDCDRLRAALSAIAALQTDRPVGAPHRGSDAVDRKSAYYIGVFDGRADARFEASEMARAALVTS